MTDLLDRLCGFGEVANPGREYVAHGHVNSALRVRSGERAPILSEVVQTCEQKLVFQHQFLLTRRALPAA